ncbi:hypothetical protein HDV00_012774 [Rhizophlyctis rosea]|nr:hypothetical protein HDV00_012774 [Rhizophlyctis rosea]
MTTTRRNDTNLTVTRLAARVSNLEQNMCEMKQNVCEMKEIMSEISGTQQRMMQFMLKSMTTNESASVVSPPVALHAMSGPSVSPSPSPDADAGWEVVMDHLPDRLGYPGCIIAPTRSEDVDLPINRSRDRIRSVVKRFARDNPDLIGKAEDRVGHPWAIRRDSWERFLDALRLRNDVELNENVLNIVPRIRKSIPSDTVMDVGM